MEQPRQELEESENDMNDKTKTVAISVAITLAVVAVGFAGLTLSGCWKPAAVADTMPLAGLEDRLAGLEDRLAGLGDRIELQMEVDGSMRERLDLHGKRLIQLGDDAMEFRVSQNERDAAQTASTKSLGEWVKALSARMDASGSRR